MDNSAGSSSPTTPTQPVTGETPDSASSQVVPQQPISDQTQVPAQPTDQPENPVAAPAFSPASAEISAPTPDVSSPAPEAQEVQGGDKKSSSPLIVGVVLALVVLGGGMAYYVASNVNKSSEQYMGVSQTPYEKEAAKSGTQIDKETDAIDEKLNDISNIETSIDQGINDQQVDFEE
jgi:hypothetical protein